MSLLDIGSRCSQCNLIDFLPFNCPICNQVFCKAHIQQHSCVQNEQRHDINRPGPSFKRAICDVQGCDKPRIEAIAGLNSIELDAAKNDDGILKIAKEVRCTGCGGAFCVSHRAQLQHSCEAPLDHNKRQDAFLARREKARAVIAEKFPDHASRINSIPKPPPQKDVIKEQPKSNPSERLPPSLSIQPEQIQSGSNLEKKPKSKAEKMYDLHFRKLKSLAKPLDGSMKVREKDERRFFEIGVDVSGEKVKEWKGKNKWDGKLDRVWVPIVSDQFDSSVSRKTESP